jgi:hypothetical protein
MYRIGLMVEYSRMPVPSLRSGCEIAQFFVRYMVTCLNFMLPKRIFWKTEQKNGSCHFDVLFKDVSTRFGRLDLVDESLKSTSKMHDISFVMSSKSFVCEASTSQIV